MTMTRDPPTPRTTPLLLAAFLISLPAQAQYGGGTGEPNDPYLIYTPAQMNAIGADPNHWDKHLKLMADIDLSAYDGRDGRPAFNAIGYDLSWDDRKPFTGVFDGNGHTISNFRHTSVNPHPYRSPVPQNNVGLFACIEGLHVEIRNLGLIRPTLNVAAGSCVGALVGRTGGGAITGCYVEDANVTGTSEVGGLVGHSSAVVSNSYSTGSVSGQANVGGLVGGNAREIIDCYSTASVSGNDSVGGLAGCPAGGRGSNLGLILNCYSTGRVTGVAVVVSPHQTTAATAIGGLIGAVGANVIGSYWDTETSGQAESAGGVGKTTLEMWTASTFLGWGACGHDGAWTIDEGRDYPRLSWEGQPGQPLGLQLADLLAGSGTADDPFLIYTAEEFNMIGLFPCEWNACFRLMSDVDMSAHAEAPFNMIGVYEIPFTGVFDGNGRSMSNLALPAGRGTGTGLFACVADPNAEIRDLRLVSCSVDGGRYGGAAALAAWLNRGTVANCHAVDTTVSGGNTVGGLVGSNTSGTISDCSSTGTVIGTYFVGGLVGQNSGPMRNCWAGSVVDGNNWVGGLIGSNAGTVTECHSETVVTGKSGGGLVGNNGSGTITHCWANGTVTGSFRVGGLVGTNSQGTITDSHASAIVTGDSVAGALVGYNGGTITKCHADANVAGHGNVGGLVGEDFDGIIADSWTSVSVKGGSSVGGLVGGARGGTIRNCHAASSVSGEDDVGGLIGSNVGTIILNCHAAGRVDGSLWVGGLIGSNGGSIMNCYATGVVSGDSRVGGLVGNGWSTSSVAASFWDFETSGQTTSAGGTGKTTAEMQIASTFLEAGWDFVGETANGTEDIWWILEGKGYPRLWWEAPAIDDR